MIYWASRAGFGSVTTVAACIPRISIMANTEPPGPDLSTLPRGVSLLRDPLLNKGTAFTGAERLVLGLQGLLPPHVFALEEQVDRVLGNYRRKSTDLERYIHLMSLQDRNETLFYRVVVDHLTEMMPILYTPTVGQACREFGHIFRRARGLYISLADRGRIAEILGNWPNQEVRIIVVTDGERILGLGDLGASGMGIPIGKLSLYTACAGIHPAQCLPVMLDVGTENQALLTDPLYTGIRGRRVRGEAYDSVVEEFIAAARARWPRVLIQFEDFGNANAFRLLSRWQDQICAFNDDIQGTAAVALAGMFSALRMTGQHLAEQDILFFGAGEAGIGIGDLVTVALQNQGLGQAEARRRCWYVDSKGLVVNSRSDLSQHKRRYAHEAPMVADLRSAIELIKPSILIGVSAVANAFDRQIIQRMSQLNQRPIVFALSNPTSKAECSAEQAYEWSDGRAIYASGSPFPPCEYGGRQFVPGQGNNAYVFPGIGLGIVASESRRVSARMFAESARALAGQVSESDLALGRVFPSLSRLREISLVLGTAVARTAFEDGLAGVAEPPDVRSLVASKMWEPVYPSYVR